MISLLLAQDLGYKGIAHIKVRLLSC